MARSRRVIDTSGSSGLGPALAEALLRAVAVVRAVLPKRRGYGHIVDIASVAAPERPDFLLVPGVQMRLMIFGIRHFPGIRRRIADRRVRAVYRGPR